MPGIRWATTLFWSGLVAAVVAGCSTPGDDPGPALPVDPGVLYAQMCARCHGADGRGDPEMKKTLPVRDFSDPTFQTRATSEEIARTIMAGKNQMPAFGASLSAPKIQSLSGFVKRLGRGGAAVPAVAPAALAAPAGAPSTAPAAAPPSP